MVTTGFSLPSPPTPQGPEVIQGRIIINNLAHDVTELDIQQLFGFFGVVAEYSLFPGEQVRLVISQHFNKGMLLIYLTPCSELRASIVYRQ